MSYIIDGGWNTHPRPQLKRELFLSLNGLYTYDRAVCKVDKAVMKEIATEISGEI